MRSYDTRAGIEEYIKTLGGLHLLKEERYQAGWQGRKEKMSNWCILGKFLLEDNGDFRFLEPHQYRAAPVMLKAEMNGEWSAFSGSNYYLPPALEKCVRCGEGWELDNVEDYTRKDDHNRDRLHYHKLCWSYEMFETTLEQFKECFTAAGYIGCRFRAIPNGYGRSNTEYHGPWFKVSCGLGEFTIGWRRHVIEIRFNKIKLRSFELPDKEVTGSVVDGFKHAYGYVKAKEYLSLLLEHAVLKDEM